MNEINVQLDVYAVHIFFYCANVLQFLLFEKTFSRLNDGVK
jgi:hypothetical protein